VCRELGFTEDDSRVSAAMMEKYQVFFNTPLEITLSSTKFS